MGPREGPKKRAKGKGPTRAQGKGPRRAQGKGSTMAQGRGSTQQGPKGMAQQGPKGRAQHGPEGRSQRGSGKRSNNSHNSFFFVAMVKVFGHFRSGPGGSRGRKAVLLKCTRGDLFKKVKYAQCITWLFVEHTFLLLHLNIGSQALNFPSRPIPNA